MSKISALEGGFEGKITTNDGFGLAVSELGDLDDDGVNDLVVGARGDSEDPLGDHGVVWVLFLHPDGTVKAQQKITDGEGGFTDQLEAGDTFGNAIAKIGDLDGDNVTDIAVGAPGANTTVGDNTGAVWVLFLHPDGTVKGHQKISFAAGGFRGSSNPGDTFGWSINSLGDLDGDGVTDIAVGSPFANNNIGVVWILFLRSDGSVRTHQRITRAEGGFEGQLNTGDNFGRSIVKLGDFDGDGITDIAVGANGDDDTVVNSGALWILYLRSDGTVKSFEKISTLEGGFTGQLIAEDSFGYSMSNLDDLDGDGIIDLVVGAPRDRGSSFDTGALWILFPNAPPRIEGTPSVTLSGESSSDVTISVNIEDATSIRDVELSIRRGGDRSIDFLDRALQPVVDNRYEAQVPEGLITDRGLEYFITATDEFDLSGRYPPEGFESLQLKVPQLSFPRLLAENQYRLISLPLWLDITSMETILTDDMGRYDGSLWRLFEPGSTGDPRDYNEFPNTSPHEPGKAFWIISANGGELIQTDSGTTVKTDVPFEIPLAEGWNYIGNPFTFAIPLRKVQLKNGGDQYSIQWYNGADWEVRQQNEELVPFEGYIVSNNTTTPDTLLIDPVNIGETSSTFGKVDGTAGKEDYAWQINISAKVKNLSDRNNRLASHKIGQAGFDRMDQPEPPLTPGEYLSLYFPHRQWENPIKHYSVDVRPELVTGDTWELELISSHREPVHLAFDGIDSVPPQYDVWLVDDILNHFQNLREVNTYLLGGPIIEKARPLKIAIGTNGYMEDELSELNTLPTEYTLNQNFPNPFNGTTTLSYGLPNPERVTIEVYNMLGERIAIIVDDKEYVAGNHAILWDGTNDANQHVASGVYIAKIQAGTFVKTIRMVLVR